MLREWECAFSLRDALFALKLPPNEGPTRFFTISPLSLLSSLLIVRSRILGICTESLSKPTL